MSILYLNDWRLYPNAIADTNTPNKSFLRYASLLKEMGIRNHMFPLALHNRELVGVDPFDENLTREQQMDIAYECKINCWYFFREVIRIPPISGNISIFLEANRANMALFWCFYNHVFTILIQPRQTGKSVSTDVLMTLLMNIQCSSTQFNLLTKDDTLRAKNIQRLKDIDSEMPYYLRQRTKEDVNNTEELSVKSRGNTYTAHVPQSSAKAAYKVGRGLTSPIFHIDEGPFQANISIALPSALAAGTAARDLARLNNEPYGTIFTTTAGKKDDRDGKYCYGLVSESAVWSEQFLDCENEAEFEKAVRRNSRSNTRAKNGVFSINITMNHRQLGKSDDWLRRAIEDARVQGEDADRDFGNIWTSGTQTHPLSIPLLEKIRGSQKGEDHTSIAKQDGYVVRWFIPELGKESYLRNNDFFMSMDTSDASGGDDISLVLTNIRTGETTACGNYNETNLIVLAEWICWWICTYERITVCIERRSSGATILDYLLLMLPTRGIDPFKRLFNRVVNDAVEYPDRFKEIQIPLGRRSPDIYIKYKKAFGFATSGTGVTSRTELYSTTLQNAAKRIGDKVRDNIIINQIAGLATINGRIDHQPGEHDDMVIAWLLNYWMMSNAMNLHFYGIDSKFLLIDAIEKKVISYEEQYAQDEQQYIKNQMETIFEKLKLERDEFLVQRLEMELKHLDRQLVLEEHDKFSVDDLINSVREEKRKKRTIINSSTSAYDRYNDPRAFHRHRDPMSVF